MRSRIRRRFTIRTLAIVVTLVCTYFGAWEATRRYGNPLLDQSSVRSYAQIPRFPSCRDCFFLLFGRVVFDQRSIDFAAEETEAVDRSAGAACVRIGDCEDQWWGVIEVAVTA